MPGSTANNNLNFAGIRYANCWEDAAVLLQGLQPKEGSTILSICSGGDNSFSLLSAKPKQVIALDINPVQLYLAELKKVCIQVLEYGEIPGFLGFYTDTHRLITYKNRLRPLLSHEAQIFWDANPQIIENGLIYAGKFERYFLFFSRKVLPLIHNRKNIERLFEPKTAEEQERFYHDVWNNLRWKGLFRIFFSRWVMGRYGRGPELMKEVKLSVHDFIFGQAEKHLKSVHAQQNGFLHFILTGTFGSYLPHYLRAENFPAIKSHIDNITFSRQSMEEAISQYDFDSLNLSNIFEYMSMPAFEKMAQTLKDKMKPGTRMAYWNLMVPRRVSVLCSADFYYDEKQCILLHDRDMGFFYKSFISERRK